MNYRKEILKFQDALEALVDPDIEPKIKNQYLKNIIERIDYERPPIVRITKDNASKFGVETQRGTQWYVQPYKLNVKLKYE